MSDPILPGGEAGLREALAYLTPHPLTKGPIVLDAPKVRDALAQLQADRTRLKAENASLREVQEAVVARWREAALMAVNGDVRRLQRLLNASQARIVGSVVRELSDEEKAARAAALADAYHREKEARNGR